MSTVAAGSSVTPVSEPQKKKARPNPARRKTTKAKAAASGAETVIVASKNNGEAVNISARQRGNGSQLGFNASTTVKVKTSAGTQQQAQSSQSTLALSRAPSKKNSDTKSNNSNLNNPPPNDGKSSSLAIAAPAMVTGGLVGCCAGAAVLLGASMRKNFAGVESAILTARSAKFCIDNLIEEVLTSLKAGTYNAPEALDMLRRTTLAYASSVPGGAPFVERIFREVDMVRRQRGHEVDKVLAEAYKEVGKAGQRGASEGEMHSVVLMQLMKLSNFATNATQDILDLNPRMRPYRDGVAKALQRPPEAKVPTLKLNMSIQHKRPTAVA